MFFTDIEYNTERPHLIIPEYGRHIQKMVDQAVAEKDPEKRNKQAKSIISVMGNLNPHLRDVADFQHKLWDQLFIISDFIASDTAINLKALLYKLCATNLFLGK